MSTTFHKATTDRRTRSRSGIRGPPSVLSLPLGPPLPTDRRRRPRASKARNMPAKARFAARVGSSGADFRRLHGGVIPNMYPCRYPRSYTLGRPNDWGPARLERPGLLGRELVYSIGQPALEPVIVRELPEQFLVILQDRHHQALQHPVMLDAGDSLGDQYGPEGGLIERSWLLRLRIFSSRLDWRYRTSRSQWRGS